MPSLVWYEPVPGKTPTRQNPNFLVRHFGILRSGYARANSRGVFPPLAPSERTWSETILYGLQTAVHFRLALYGSRREVLEGEGTGLEAPESPEKCRQRIGTRRGESEHSVFSTVLLIPSHKQSQKHNTIEMDCTSSHSTFSYHPTHPRQCNSSHTI